MNVPYDLTSLWDVLARSADVVATSSAKAVLLLALAGLVALALGRASAAVRHGVWSLALASVLVLLPLSLLVPSWPVALFPQTSPSTDVQAPPPPPSAPLVADPASGAGQAVQATPEPLVLKSGTSELVFGEATAVQAESSPPEVVAPRASDAGTDVALFETVREAVRGTSWAAWAMLLWALGAVAVLAYFALGTVRAWWWTWRAAPVEDEAWTSLAKDVAWMLCLKRPVRLRWSEKAAMPMAWGVLRPVVLLPKSAAAWTAERRRVVLLHEMAHIQRWDPLTQALAQVACAFHWCNPFVWWGARRLRVERERACDDQVITSGTKASTYASHLLAIARSLRATPGPAFGTVSMARPSQLEGRLLAILEPNLSRRTLGRARSLMTGGLFAAALVPLAAMQPWADVEASRTSGEGEPKGAFAFAFSTQTETFKAVAKRTSADEEVYEKSFEVNPGGLLTIRTDRGSVEVQTHNADRVDIRATVDARDEEARENFMVYFERSGDDVLVRGEQKEKKRWNWNGDRLRVAYVVTVPERFDVDLQTSGGSISVEDLEGAVQTKTSGGSLSFGMIRGDIEGRTSGGSISLNGTSGSADVHTSGGSISLGKVAGTVKAHTSGGSITIDEVAGTIDARTSGGSIRAAITEQPAERRASSGRRAAPSPSASPTASAWTSSAKTSAGRVTTDFDVPPRDRDDMDELDAAINGGGPALRLRTSAGSIRINRLNGEGASLERRDEGDGERYGAAEEAQAERAALAEAARSAAETLRAAEETEQSALVEAAQNAAELLRAAEEAQSEEEREELMREYEEQREEIEEQREEVKEAMRDAEEAHEEARQEMEEAMREMDVDINEAVEEAMAEVDMDEINEAIEEAMADFGEAMAEMGEALAEAFADVEITDHEAQEHGEDHEHEGHEDHEHDELPSGTVSGSINGVGFSGTVADVLGALEENFDMEGFAEEVERSALEGVTEAFEEMAYAEDSVEVTVNGEKAWRDPLDVLAELPAAYAVPALERVAGNHEDEARRAKAARLAGKLAAEAETSEDEGP